MKLHSDFTVNGKLYAKGAAALIFFLLLFLAASRPARADVSLVQIVQSQTSQGESGLFGKTWIEVSGRKMRLVSGFAGKLPAKRRAKAAEPVRIVQILDLDTTSLMLLNASSKTYELRGLSEIRYADSLHGRVRRDEPEFSIAGSTVTVERGALRRPCAEAECEHFHILVELALRGPDGKTAPARLAQDVWMAPVAGALQKGFLDLISFEAAYRKLTQDAFTPLDYETYQIREAAAYLHVPPKQLAAIVSQVKHAFADIPGYPMWSSVSWWRRERPEDRPPTVKPSKPAPPQAQPASFRVRRPPRPVFKPINWRYSINSINRAGPKRDSGIHFPLGPLRRPIIDPQAEYVEFQREMTSVISALLPPEPPPAEPAPSPRKAKRVRAAPFYEIFAETKEIEFVEALPKEDFAPPAGYKKL